MISLTLPTGSPVIGTGATNGEAMCNAINTLTDAIEAIVKGLGPVTEGVRGLYPSVVYFGTKAEQEDFERMIRETHPNLKQQRL